MSRWKHATLATGPDGAIARDLQRKNAFFSKNCQGFARALPGYGRRAAAVPVCTEMDRRFDLDNFWLLPSGDWSVFVRFQFKELNESALSFCIGAFPDGEPVSTSPGNALERNSGRLNRSDHLISWFVV
jgi:hypothetical protein